jgi:hypothetical protein
MSGLRNLPSGDDRSGRQGNTPRSTGGGHRAREIIFAMIDLERTQGDRRTNMAIPGR